MRNFKDTAKFKFTHEFFQNKELVELFLSPLPETARKMANYHVILKKLKGDWFLKHEFVSEDEPLIGIDSHVPMVFGIKTNDPYFNSKTALPDHYRSTHKFVFSTSGEVDVLPFFKSTLSFSQEEHGNLVIKRNGEDLIELKENSFDDQGVFILSFSGTAYYQLAKNGELIYSFIGSDFDENYDGLLFHELTGEFKERKLKFASKKIRWQYIIDSKYGRDLNLVKLKEENERILFDFTESEIKGKKVVSFLSIDELSLKERYDFALVLEYNGDVLKKIIPFPSLKNFAKCEKNVDKYVLQTYLSI